MCVFGLIGAFLRGLQSVARIAVSADLTAMWSVNGSTRHCGVISLPRAPNSNNSND